MVWFLLIIILLGGCVIDPPPTSVSVPQKVGFIVENQYGESHIEIPKTMYEILRTKSGIKISSPGFYPYQGQALEQIALEPQPEFWLASIIWAEARGERFDGQAAVGQVILNRVKDPRFNNSIVDVVFETTQSISGKVTWQFSPAQDGQIFLAYTAPDFEQYLDLASGLLSEQHVNPRLDEAVGFFNPAKVEIYDPQKNNWVWKQPVVFQIGNHVFFKVP